VSTCTVFFWAQQHDDKVKIEIEIEIEIETEMEIEIEIEMEIEIEIGMEIEIEMEIEIGKTTPSLVKRAKIMMISKTAPSSHG
jgi:hypothetical protein